MENDDMRTAKLTTHPHLAAIEAAFPGSPDDVIASWLLDLADDFGPPSETWHPHIGNTLGLWKSARWSRRIVSILDVDSDHRQVVLRMVNEYRAGSKVVTRNGRARIESLVAYVRANGVLPYPPTVAEFLRSPYMSLMDGHHRWVAWTEVRGPAPLECWVASF